MKPSNKEGDSIVMGSSYNEHETVIKGHNPNTDERVDGNADKKVFSKLKNLK